MRVAAVAVSSLKAGLQNKFCPPPTKILTLLQRGFMPRLGELLKTERSFYLPPPHSHKQEGENPRPHGRQNPGRAVSEDKQTETGREIKEKRVFLLLHVCSLMGKQ